MLAINEFIIILFRKCASLNQIMKIKPIKSKIKVQRLCFSHSNCLSNFETFQSQSDEADTWIKDSPSDIQLLMNKLIPKRWNDMRKISFCNNNFTIIISHLSLLNCVIFIIGTFKHKSLAKEKDLTKKICPLQGY